MVTSAIPLSLPEVLFWAVVAGSFTALFLYDLFGWLVHQLLLLLLKWNTPDSWFFRGDRKLPDELPRLSDEAPHD